MRIIFYVLSAGVAAVVTFGLALLIWKLSTKYRLHPKIRERDVHTNPTPRLGGIAMFIGVVAAFAVGSQLPQLSIVFSEPSKILAVLGAAAIIVGIGVADDIWDLDWLTKLAGQIIAAALLAWQGIQIVQLPGLQNTGLLLSPYMFLAITVFLVVLVMNAVNFIDGLDGLVVGVAIIANSVFFIYSYVVTYEPTAQSAYFNLPQFVSAVLIGACVGFLPLNWHPAKLFMGDAGALLVGLLMATSTIGFTGNIDLRPLSDKELLPAFIPILLPFAVLVIPLLDFGLAVFRRLRAGKSPFSADRLHLHHRLLDMGHSHLHAVLIFYAWTATASVGLLLFLFTPSWVAIVVTATGLVVCTIVTLSPLSRRKAVEAAVQLAPEGVTTDAEVAYLDPLDAASDPIGVDQDRTDAEAETALTRLQQREASS
ncbi:MAG: undecaprenyl/decaprenyl-phosphate alpha-N-acetylglucosaminyl 1-phosphate transferase [Actinomycetota bacterium]|nr:undecaprenyl/decaprenyl-phosphate alpha-N-acetylglucosaminyl 1-phosphate transferase [Actinomycetota bacterium]